MDEDRFVSETLEGFTTLRDRLKGLAVEKNLDIDMPDIDSLVDKFTKKAFDTVFSEKAINKASRKFRRWRDRQLEKLRKWF